MCLAVPARIVEITRGDALVEIEGVRRGASLMLLPEAAIGDWVLLHAGYAIERIDEEDAAETLRLLREAFGEIAEQGAEPSSVLPPAPSAGG